MVRKPEVAKARPQGVGSGLGVGEVGNRSPDGDTEAEEEAGVEETAAGRALCSGSRNVRRRGKRGRAASVPGKSGRKGPWRRAQRASRAEPPPPARVPVSWGTLEISSFPERGMAEPQPGHVPWWEWNWQPLGAWAKAQPRSPPAGRASGATLV